MVRLMVRITGIRAETGAESVLAAIESDRYDPDHLEDQLKRALDTAVSTINGHGDEAPRVWQPEVSIALTADEGEVRPSMHLSASTLLRLTSTGASFDFDPYL